MGVTVGGQYFKLVLAIHFGDFDDGNIEGTTTQVINRHHGITALLVHTVSQCGGGRLVDDALHIQTGDTAGIFGGLTLTVVEVGRYRDHRFGDRFTQIVFGGLLHFLQNFRRHLRGRHLFAVGFHPGITIVGLDDLEGGALQIFLHFVVSELASDQTLHRKQGVVGVGHRLTFGGLTHQDLPIFVVGNDGRSGTITFAVLDNLGLVTLHYRYARVGCTQVDADNFTHFKLSAALLDSGCLSP